MPDSFLYFFPRIENKEGGLSNFKSTFRGVMAFFFFPGRGHNYLLYLLMEFASAPCPGINNEWSLIEFTLSNARQFYSSTENPSGLKGLSHFRKIHQKNEELTKCVS